MSSLARQNNEQEISELLLKVQDELKGLRTLISKDGTKIDLKHLQISLAKVENEIKEKTDTIVNNLNSQVKILPIHGEIELASLESLWDMTKKGKNRDSRTSNNEFNSNSKLALVVAKDQELVSKTRPNELVMNDQQPQDLQMSKYTAFGPTPGQQVKIDRETRALFNPMNSKNREALQENYNIQLPLIERRTTYKMPTHLITGSTVEHLSTLPLIYKRHPTLMPPAIGDNEAKHGLLSLIERGLIPTSAKIEFFPVPVEAQPIKLSYPDRTSNKLKEISSTLAIESVYKLDPNFNLRNPDQSSVTAGSIRIASNSKDTDNSEKQKFLKKKAESQLKLTNGKSNLNPKNSLNPLPPPVTPSNALQLQLYDSSKYTHRFVIQNGKARTDMPDYITFKQSFSLRWGSIITIIKYIEDLCQTFSIAVGFIDGLKVSELALCIDMDLKPTIDELIDTFLNKEDVEKMVKAPGRKFKRKGGHHLAATIIQCAWRRYRDRKSYLKYRKRKWAAGVIALTWLTYCKIAKAREKLKATRQTHLGNFKKRQKELIRNWPKLKNSKRVVIHIPSLGLNESIRDRMNELTIRESYQMARICDILDENVDVIYVSAIPITEETLQYYFKLLSLRTAIQTGSVSDQKDISHRYKVVIPEALKSFPTHNMSLSTLLKYSPKALERIKNLIKGRDAYIVPGVMNHDDLHVSDFLNVPILASEPEIANLYTTKSGSKRIFQSAQVKIPFGEFDIYNKEQLYECFAQAITENLHVQRWLFKLDDECDGRGIGYCDISKHLSCYQWALKEMTKFGDKWSKRWAYEPTYVKILEEIPEVLNKHGKPANTKVYETWEAFQNAFLAQGGVLEAHPPSDSITSLTVSVLIEPDQSYRIISSGDHIHADSQYSCWGLSFPQTSVDPTILNSECNKIINACKQRNIIGYLDIDFITFIDSKTEKQVIWATDLNIFYTENVSLASLLFYMTNGHFDFTKHSFDIPIEIKPTATNKKNTKEIKKEKEKENTSRYCVMSSKLHHSNLAVVHYSVFFQTCRALGIGYDIQEKQGTVFSLIDSINHIHLGMLTITDHLQTAFQQFEHNLKALHNEISSANMQGRTNFITAAADIRSILNEYNDTNDDDNEEEVEAEENE